MAEEYNEKELKWQLTETQKREDDLKLKLLIEADKRQTIINKLQELEIAKWNEKFKNELESKVSKLESKVKRLKISLDQATVTSKKHMKTKRSAEEERDGMKIEIAKIDEYYSYCTSAWAGG